jgi:hypothetical protein
MQIQQYEDSVHDISKGKNTFPEGIWESVSLNGFGVKKIIIFTFPTWSYSSCDQLMTSCHAKFVEHESTSFGFKT